MVPSKQPFSSPTALPTSSPSPKVSAGSWVTTVEDAFEITKVLQIGEEIWACGTVNVSARVWVIDGTSGEMIFPGHRFPWNVITGMIDAATTDHLTFNGQIIHPTGVSSEVGYCEQANSAINCAAKSFSDTRFVTSTFVPYLETSVFMGSYHSSPSVSTVRFATGAVESYIYTSKSLHSISIRQAQSLPNFVGSFVAGTGVSSAGSISYIVVGMVRADSGAMTGLALAPQSGRIVGNMDLVNAMAIDFVNPDLMIVGGLELSDGEGKHAYVLRVNPLFGTIRYCVRYRTNTPRGDEVETGGSRRASNSPSTAVSSVARGMVRVDTVLYMLVDLIRSYSNSSSSLTVLKINAETGLILQQVHVASPNASLSCTDITASANGLILYIACRMQYHQSRAATSIVIATDQLLNFAVLPSGFAKQYSQMFEAEMVPFKSSPIPVTARKTQPVITNYEFNTADDSPTPIPTQEPSFQPSSQPSSAPSGQPSSSPTSAPSVSPQPTSHPSSSGPTNTYQPTVKPTQRPSARPSRGPTAVPSFEPIPAPTVRPSCAPSTHPSTQPSRRPTTGPTRFPSAKPSIKPTQINSAAPSQVPSIAPSVVVESSSKRKNSDIALVIGGSVIGGLLALWCGNWLLKSLIYAAGKLERRSKLRQELDMIHKQIEKQPEHSPHLPDYTPKVRKQVNAAPVEAAVGATVGAYAESVTDRPRGAYATGKAVIPAMIGSDSSSSIIVSSLHSSEMSDISYSIYSEESYSKEHTSQSLSTRSIENAMEEGTTSDIILNSESYASGSLVSNDDAAINDEDISASKEGESDSVVGSDCSAAESSFNSGCG